MKSTVRERGRLCLASNAWSPALAGEETQRENIVIVN